MIFDFGDGFAIKGADSTGRSNIFPFESLFLKTVFFMAGLEAGRVFGETAIFGDAATNAGTESEVDGFARQLLTFKNCSKIGVIHKKYIAAVQFF